MTKPASARIQDLVGLINRLYPPALAEEWDNVGLQVGDPSAPLSRVLVCLDPGEQALAAAEKAGAQALVSHHPLIFRPLRSLTPTDATGRTVWQAVQKGIAIFSAHTNLDRSSDGLNDWLAQRLEIESCQPLSQGGADLLKLVVYVPEGHEESVAEALFAAGAGQVGRYDRCSFRSAGTGTFRPGEGTVPFIGEQGVKEEVAEIRLETILPRERLSRGVPRMLKAHPYEEVAYDLIPLMNQRSGVGLGRIGRLGETTTLEAFASRVRELLGADSLRVVGGEQTRVSKVAVCGGSGASLLAEAARQGADVFVTGDVKYHEARHAESLGMALIDAGHFATEVIMARALATRLQEVSAARGLDIEFVPMEGEQDPFRIL